MDIHSSASERISIVVDNTLVSVSFHDYLRQPQLLVEAITSPKLIETISEYLFSLKMYTLHKMELYHL
ncbi:MAG: DUF1997 domain-containing protein [cyanobacterium endosymbiont of Epithemia adnata isolate EadnSB Bon19]